MCIKGRFTPNEQTKMHTRKSMKHRIWICFNNKCSPIMPSSYMFLMLCLLPSLLYDQCISWFVLQFFSFFCSVALYNRANIIYMSINMLFCVSCFSQSAQRRRNLATTTIVTATNLLKNIIHRNKKKRITTVTNNNQQPLAEALPFHFYYIKNIHNFIISFSFRLLMKLQFTIQSLRVSCWGLTHFAVLIKNVHFCDYFFLIISQRFSSVVKSKVELN